MAFEIIVIAIFASAAMLAALLAVHNIQELRDTRIKYDAAQNYKSQLEVENEQLKSKAVNLERALTDERKNSKELRQIIIDYEIAANTQQEELKTVENADDEEILHANAKSKERLPEGRTNWISGEPLTAFTNKASQQWKLQLQAHTGKYGIRCYFDGEHIYFLSAMGSAYGRTIGDAFRVTLRCGTVMYVMLADFKDDGSTDFFGHTTDEAGNILLNYDHEPYTCIFEFIYDPEKIDKRVLGENGSGTFTVFEEFGGLYGDGGDVVKIEYLGRKWEP